MKKSLLTLALISLFVLNSNSQTITRLIGASPFDNTLRVFDSSSYVQLSTKNIVSNIGAVNGLFGLAIRPSTGIYYTIFNVGGNRYLGTINLTTGSITSIGNLGDNFSHLTINGNNTLLGVTGSGAAVPSTVYRLNPTNAAKTIIAGVVGGAGQVICYNPTNNRVYHWTQSYPYVLTSYDTLFTTPISLPGSNSGEPVGAVYKTNNSFVLYDWDQNFMKVHGGGVTSGAVSFNTQTIKSLSYITCSRTITASSASVCGTAPISFTMSGTPGATYQWFKNNLLIPGATSMTYATVGGGYFKCRITDGCGVDSLAPGKNIFVLSTPTVAITGASAACVGQTIQLVGSSGGTSQWYKNGVSIVGANTNSYVVSTSGTYNMIKTNLNGCLDSAQVGKVVTIYNNPTVSIVGSNNTICLGDVVTYTASGAGTYSWSTLANTSIITVTPSASTTYTLVGANGGVCFGSATIGVNVNALPVISIAPSSSVVCLNSTTVILTPSGGLTYTWFPVGIVAASLAVSPTLATSYTVTGTDANGCKNSSSILLPVVNIPTVTAVGSQTNVCSNTSVTLTATGALSYLWNDGTASSLNVVAPANTTVYIVTGTDANGCSSTGNVVITVKQSPVVNVNSNTSNTICPSEKVTLTASGGSSYLWSTGTATLIGANVNVTPSLTTTYTVSTTGTNGCVGLKTFMVTVNPCLNAGKNIADNAKVKFYPNPSNGQLFVESADKITSVEVYDLNGKLVFKQEVNQLTQFQISLDSLSNSLYFVRVNHNSGKVTEAKITIDK